MPIGQFTWTVDTPTGVLKNHSLSAKLREESYPEAVFGRYVAVEPGFGMKKGESHNITRVGRLSEPTNARISET